MGELMGAMTGLLLGGALFGLIPLGVGFLTGKRQLGLLGLLFSTITALLSVDLILWVAVGFTIAVVVRKRDVNVFRIPGPITSTGHMTPPVRNGVPALRCLSGPLKGSVYRIDSGGLAIGRGGGCAVRFPDGTPGISRRHCSLIWRGRGLALVDLGSSYGTYLADGTRLPPNYPAALTVGSVFTAGSGNQFQIVTL